MVGWRNSELDLFVVTILEDAEVRNVEHALKMNTLYRGSPHPISRIFEACRKSNMQVLGVLNHANPSPDFDPSHIYAYTFQKTGLPLIYCPSDIGLSVQIIVVDLPSPSKMQYMSIRPMSLALGSSHTRSEGSLEAYDTLDPEEEKEKATKAMLVKKLKLHTVIKHSLTKKEEVLPAILNQANCCLELAELLQKNSPLIGPRRKRSMSVSERVVEGASSLYTYAALTVWNIFLTYAYPVVSYTFIVALILHRMLAEGLLQLLEWRLPRRHHYVLEDNDEDKPRPALKDISASFQQIHIRLQQFSYYPIQYLVLRRRHLTWASLPVSNSDYIRFYNSLWLVANDIIIGIALGSYIIENASSASRFISMIVNDYTIVGLKSTIRWLMSYPAGLKLNNELAAFLGDLFLWVIEYWAALTDALVMPYLPILIRFIGFSSFAGASLPIAMFSDLLSLLTLHIYSFYIASARIFHWQLSIIYSLFHLFRGKKRNVLRNRIDNCDYDLDQLLLGTILFTLLFFLLPTVIVFYLTFASARMGIITVKASLDTCLAFLNHFPLFALMLRIKDPGRLPGGIRFTLMPNPTMPIFEAETEVEESNGDADMSTPTFTPETVDTSSAESDTPPLSRVPTDTSHQSTSANHVRSFSNYDISRTVSHEDPTSSISTISYIHLSSTPLPLRLIFAQYFHLAARIRKHYLSPRVVFSFVTGRSVPPLGRGEMYGLQYSMLPRERVGVGAVWRGLVEGREAFATSM